MPWKHVADSLPAWLRAEIQERTGAAEGPGQVREQRQGEENPDGAYRDRNGAALLVSRNMDRAMPTRRPSAARSIFLVIDNEGSGPAVSGGVSRAAYRAGGEGTAREFLRLVR